MANFGFAHLVVVAPYEEHWREAKSAVGASDLLQDARRTESLAEAVAECTLVIGTGTIQHRKPEQAVILLPELAHILGGDLDSGGRVALVFGPEKRGLTREDLALCHVLVEIPTEPRQPSMNLGQAVAVCLYELATRSKADDLPRDENKDVVRSRHRNTAEDQAGRDAARDPVCARDLELLAEVVAETMQAANYSPAAMQKANRHDLELLLRRLELGQQDARRILGLFRRILWRLKR